MKKILVLMTCIYGGFASSGNDVPLNDVPLNDVQLNDVQLNDVPLNDVPLNDVQLNDIYTSLNSLDGFTELNIYQEVIKTMCLIECEKVKKDKPSVMVELTKNLFSNLIRVMGKDLIANQPDKEERYALDRLFEATTCMIMQSIQELLGSSQVDAGNGKFLPEAVRTLVWTFFECWDKSSTKHQMEACFQKLCYTDFVDCAEKNSNQNVLRIIKLLAGRGGLISKVHNLAVTISRYIQDILDASSLAITLQDEVLLPNTDLPNEPLMPQTSNLTYDIFEQPISLGNLSQQALNLLNNASGKIANMTHDEQDMLDELCNLVTELTEGPTSA